MAQEKPYAMKETDTKTRNINHTTIDVESARNRGGKKLDNNQIYHLLVLATVIR